jgi:predicted nucleic acid-binding protein
MFLLDTNVVSELRKIPDGKANPTLSAWAKQADPKSFFLSVITVMELEIGIRRIERRDVAQGSRLRAWMQRRVISEFEGRILPVDLRIAQRCAALHVPNPKPERDSLIAATALVHGLTIVTRNVGDFAGTDVTLLNPWNKAT